jgi:putative flippase GtrA
VIAAKRLLKFSIAGVVNTVVGYAVIAGCMRLGVSPSLSNLSGYLVGLVISFVQSRYWVFESTGRIGDEWLKFIVVFAVSYAANFLTLRALLTTPINPYLAQLLACAVFTLVNFSLNSRFVFERNANSDHTTRSEPPTPG